jgi:hypothetical protein
MGRPLAAPFKIRPRLDSVFVDVEDATDAWVCLVPSVEMAEVIRDCLNYATGMARKTETQVAMSPRDPIYDARVALGLCLRRSEAA